MKGMKKRMAFVLILLVGWHIKALPGVMITGILDGTLTGGCPKAIELYVSGTENLNYYEIWRSLNGAPFGEGTGAISSLFGVYTNTFVYLVKTDHVNAFHDVFGNEGVFANVIALGIVSGNGNDGFQIRQKVGSVVIDQVWLEDDTYSYSDSYWYRNHGTGPDGGWLPSNWATPGIDFLDGMDEPGLEAAVPFGTYAVLWQGITTAWDDSLNWTNGMPPSFGTNVIIRGAVPVYPVITNLPLSPAVCRNLTLTDTARLTVAAGKALSVHGNLVIDSLAGENADKGLILVTDTVNSLSGSLILYGEPSGKIKMECFIGKDNGWHFISSPVDSQAMQPVFVPAPLDQSFDLYYWDELADFSSGWVNIRDENGQWSPGFESTFISGKGYLLAYSPFNEGQLVRIFAGLPNTGNVNLPLSHSGNFRNLLGNPYTCAIDWTSEGITKNHIAGSAMYIWDPALNGNLGGYRSHNGTAGVPAGTSPIIPPMQGFFVESLGSGYLPVDILNDEPLVHGDQAYYKNQGEMPAWRIRLKIAKGLLTDEALIYFDPEAGNEYDPEYDALKFFNGHPGCPEIYTQTGSGKQLCINILASHPVSVPIGITHTQEDSLMLSVFDFEEMPEDIGIFLEDQQADLLINLRETPGYLFLHNPLYTESRHILHFTNAAFQSEPEQAINIHCWYASGNIYISNPLHYTGSLAIYTSDGRRLNSHILSGSDECIAVDLPCGVYILKMFTPIGVSGHKVFIY